MKKRNISKKEGRVSFFSKVVFGLIILLYFLIGYFFISSLADGSYADPTIFIDRVVPFIPFFTLFYFAGYAFMALPFLISSSRKDLFLVFVSFFGMMSVSFVAFYFFPMAITRPVPAGVWPFSFLVALQQKIDTPFNTFPSLHVSLDLFSYLVIRNKSKKWGLYLLPIIICMIFSTMAVKQHFFIDVLGGIVIGSLAFWMYKKYSRK